MIKSLKNLVLGLALMGTANVSCATLDDVVDAAKWSWDTACAIPVKYEDVVTSTPFIYAGWAALGLATVHATVEGAMGLVDKFCSKQKRAKKPGFLGRIGSRGTKFTNFVKAVIILALGWRLKKRIKKYAYYSSAYVRRYEAYAANERCSRTR